MTQDPHLDELASKFFSIFSRTEYALKVSGFHNGDGDAEVNWKMFATKVENLITDPESPELKEAIDFLFSSPPKKQVIKSSIIQWESSEPQTNLRADKLLIYIRRVRNNLFHGGKFNDQWFSPERSDPLIA